MRPDDDLFEKLRVELRRGSLVLAVLGTLKQELVHRTTFATREEARRSLFDYIEVFYNRSRLHSTLGYLSPVQYEEGRKLHPPRAH